MTTLPLNKNVLSIFIVSLKVITAVINKIIKEKLCIKIELFFLNTPKINKNMIDNEIKISGNIKYKFSIMVYKVSLDYMFELSLLQTLQLCL